MDKPKWEDHPQLHGIIGMKEAFDEYEWTDWDDPVQVADDADLASLKENYPECRDVQPGDWITSDDGEYPVPLATIEYWADTASDELEGLDMRRGLALLVDTIKAALEAAGQDPGIKHL